MKTQGEILHLTGGYINQGALANIPGVQSAYGTLLARVQALPFVPASWTGDVKAAMAEDGGKLWQPRHATQLNAWRANKLDPLNPDNPTWVTNDPQAVRAWNMLADWWAEQLQPIIAGWARNEAETLDAANADAAFWNALYIIVKPVAVVGDVILAAPEKIGNVASGAVLGALRGFAPILIIAAVVGIGVVLYQTGSYKKLLPK